MDSSNFDLSNINFSQKQLDSSTNAHILLNLFCEVTLLSFHPKDGTQKYTPFRHLHVHVSVDVTYKLDRRNYKCH